ncbi:mechanosensitive ion channel family protein [Oxalicibacterium solurbis]|nr:mechanosensitive ion channel domain-containing protein [Oxalicibacterium solurbis]
MPHGDAYGMEETSHALAADAVASSQEMRQSMPLLISNRKIIVLKGPIVGLSATERVANSTKRIEDVLRATKKVPQIAIEDIEDGRATRITLDGKPAFVVTPIDIDPQAGETTQIVARETAKRLHDAMAEWQEQRTMRYIGMAILRSVAATLIFAAILWLLARANRYGMHKLAMAGQTQLQKTAGGRLDWLDRGFIHVSIMRLLRLLGWMLVVILGIAWLIFVLEQFPYTRPWGEGFEDSLVQLLADSARQGVAAVPGLVLVAIIAVIARMIMRIVSEFFRRVGAGKIEVTWLSTDTVRPTQRIVNFIVVAFALVMAYPYLPGAGTEAFKGLSVLIGLMISLGGASIIGQALSGLILMYIKAFKTGDYVRIGEAEGVITDVGMFTTRMRTGTEQEIILPNKSVMESTTVNYSRPSSGSGCIIDTTVTIGYTTPWRQVEAMLLEAVKRTPYFADQPQPFVRQTALSDFYVEYKLVACLKPHADMTRSGALTALHGHIQDVFNTYGVQIMSPHYESDPPEPQVIKEGDWRPHPAKPSAQDS